MKDILTILSIIFMVFCVTCGIHEKKLKEANNAGYQAGYTESYNSISNEYEPKFTAQKKEFQTKLNTLEKEYQKKISKAKEDGLYKGKQDQLQSVNDSIDKNAEKAQKSNKWNQVLYEVQ